jgi:HAD superfamily hydrolase (TIGR01549 family)
MRNFDGIIFDVDGTLTSTNDLIFESFRYISNKYFKKALTNEEIMSLFGPTEDVILKEWSSGNYDKIRKDYYSFYKDNHYMADLYPGIKDILAYIKLKGVLLSIYTGKGREAAAITLKKLGIFEYFDMIMTGDDVKEHKPSAEGINNFVVKFNLDKKRVLMIGDSPADVIAARAAGVKVASVVWDSYVKDEVHDLDSDYLFRTVKDLDNFIRQNM